MKVKLLVLFILVAAIHSYAQQPEDALRYSFLSQYGGTARNQAIGGAGGALGGEFTSMFINPAGLGFYKTGDFAFTPAFSFQNSKSKYLGNSESAKNNSFSIGTTGFILASPTNGKSVKSFAIGFGINRVADFNNHIYYKGLNTNSSFSEQYLEQLVNDNVTDPNDAANKYPEGSSLAFNTYLIDTIQNPDGSVGGYRSQANPAFGLTQENTINTSGGITDASVAAGFNVKDKWYFGGSLSFPFLKYNRDASYKESDASGDPNNNFNYFIANESLQTKGIGVNGKFGVIFNPTEEVRLGLAFHTPTFYQLTDEYTAEVITDLEGYGGAGVKHQSSTDLSEGQPLESKYKLTTPWRAILSGAYVIREVENVREQRGFITADIEYVNYKAASYHDANNNDTAKEYYPSLNKTIDDLYKNAINVRLGGELKFNTMMFRLGGAYYGNPYQNQSANLIKISGGIGYRNRGMYIDLTYVYSTNKDINYPYRLEDKPNVPAYLKNNSGNIVASIGFKL
jgi:hypothetical protein